MFIEESTVHSNIQIAENTFIIKSFSPQIASIIKPGQFCNIKVNDGYFPLLRRPFSICDVENESLTFMYKIVGEGTKILSQKKEGDSLNLLGPLGNSFNYKDNFNYAIILAGGIGFAPFPYLIKKLQNIKDFSVLLGIRNKSELFNFPINNLYISSDDGSIGLKGTVIDLLKNNLKELNKENIKIFACGPNAMLKSLKYFCEENNIRCEASLESAMACGFGICQGCPIEMKDQDNYNLICKDGPIFNIEKILI